MEERVLSNVYNVYDETLLKYKLSNASCLSNQEQEMYPIGTKDLIDFKREIQFHTVDGVTH